MTASVDQLVRLLDVRPEGDATFSGCPSGSVLPRLFGGHVLGQALAAAGCTVDRGRRPHSLHAYFLRAGASERSIDYEVSTLREGRSFSTREVRARQGAKLIFTMTASFHLDEPGPEYQCSVPSAPPPHTLARNSERPEAWPDIYREWTSLDIRRVPPEVAGAVHRSGERSSRARSWSLDHSVWFHRPCRVDDWLLYDQTTPSTSGALGLAHGRILTADGTLAASVAQEGLIRRER
jgi:acyl-CoA thioesterase-2